jgi:hypothetical protein
MKAAPCDIGYGVSSITGALPGHSTPAVVILDRFSSDSVLQKLSIARRQPSTNVGRGVNGYQGKMN